MDEMQRLTVRLCTPDDECVFLKNYSSETITRDDELFFIGCAFDDFKKTSGCGNDVVSSLVVNTELKTMSFSRGFDF